VNSESAEAGLRRDLRRLVRSLDFVSRHPALKRNSAAGRQLAEIYQQLGLAWEFLVLQCKHRCGWRKLPAGRVACKICGLIRGGREPWLLLPRDGKKAIGRHTLPNSRRTFPNRRSATVVNDTIDFHGAKLNVEVLNEHRRRRRGFRKPDRISAAERLVRLNEGGMAVRFDTHLVTVELRKRQRGEKPPYSHFVWELPRKFLKNFPVMLQFDKRRRFTGLVIFKPEQPRRGRKA